jgi:hypothetical protein
MDAPEDYVANKSCASYIEKVSGFVQQKKTLEECFSASNESVRELMKSMLTFDPKKRFNAKKLL